MWHFGTWFRGETGSGGLMVDFKGLIQPKDSMIITVINKIKWQEITTCGEFRIFLVFTSNEGKRLLETSL